MVYMENWKMMMYLGTPVMPDLNALITSGLYINDLSMHDFSRYLYNNTTILLHTQHYKDYYKIKGWVSH